MGLGPCVPGAPRRPFILRLRGFAPPGRVAGSGAWAGLRAGAGRQRRGSLASRPNFGDSAWTLVLSAPRAEGQRGAGAVVVVAVVHERWPRSRPRTRRPLARPVSPSLASSQLLSGRRGVARRDPGSDPACVPQPSGKSAQCAALPLSLRPVEAKPPGPPRPAFVRRGGRGVGLRGPLMRPSAPRSGGRTMRTSPLFGRGRSFSACAADCAAAAVPAARKLPPPPASGTSFLATRPPSPRPDTPSTDTGAGGSGVPGPGHPPPQRARRFTARCCEQAPGAGAPSSAGSPRPRTQRAVTAAAAAAAHLLSTAGEGGGPGWREVVLGRE